MSASADMKLSEYVRGRLEDFLEAECLVEDICTHDYQAREKQVQNTKKKKTKQKNKKKKTEHKT